MLAENDRFNIALKLKKQEDYLTATLLDFYRSIENEDNWFHAVTCAKSHLYRALDINSQNLEKRLIFFASQLKNNLSAQTIRNFSAECLSIAAKFSPSPNAKNAPLKLDSTSALQKRALKNIRTFINSGHSEEASILRAANSLAQEKKKEEQRAKRARRLSEHPLKDTLEILCSKAELPREDIRNHLLNLKTSPEGGNFGQGQLFSMLKKAQAFSVFRLHQLLGDELFFLCRPLGFLDRVEICVLVEVPTSSHLNALIYRKNEILKALKADPSFKNTQNIRFVVRHGRAGATTKG